MAITITVAGEAELRHPAQRATVTLTVGFEGEQRDDVVRRSTALHNEMAAEIGDYYSPAEPSGPVVEWSSEQLRVWGQRPWSQTGEQLAVVYHSAASLTATFVDFSALAQWVGDVSLRDGITLNGIVWSLNDETKYELQTTAQRNAVASAVTKANTYAQTLGYSSITPLAVSDVGLFGDDENRPMPRMMMASSMDSARGGNGDAIELKPEAIRLSAAVHARFSASSS